MFDERLAALFIIGGIDFTTLDLPFRSFPSQLQTFIHRKVNARFCNNEVPQSINNMILNYHKDIEEYNVLVT